MSLSICFVAASKAGTLFFRKNIKPKLIKVSISLIQFSMINIKYGFTICFHWYPKM